MKYFDKNIKIRLAVPEDAMQVLRIYNHYVTDTIVTFDLEPISEFEFRKSMAQIMEKFPFYVAEKDGEVMGYAYATEWKSRRAYQFTVESSIYMDPDHKGKGVGYNLYFKLLKELRNMDLHSVIAGISLPNVVSVELHEKMGYQKIAHFKEVGYKFDRWIDVGYWELIFPIKTNR